MFHEFSILTQQCQDTNKIETARENFIWCVEIIHGLLSFISASHYILTVFTHTLTLHVAICTFQKIFSIFKL